MVDLQNIQPVAIIATLALIVSSISLYVSFSSYRRDRAKLQIKSVFYAPSEYNEQGSISVSIVNAGRRPIILRLLGHEGDGTSVGSYFGDHQTGLRLGEHERHDLRITPDDLVQQTPEDVFEVTKIWIEDSLGRRYNIKGIEKQIKQLRDAQKPAD